MLCVRSRWLAGAAAVVAAAAASGSAVAGRPVNTRPAALRPAGTLTTAGQVRALPAAEADLALSVRLTGVVTFVAEDRSFFFMQDATDGIFIDATTQPALSARAGDLAIVDGASASGLFAPQVRLRHFVSSGAGVLPDPQPSSFADLASGKMDSRLVVVQGTVRSVGREPPRPDGQVRLVMNLADGGATFEVRLHLADAADARPERLIDATVALRGVCGGMFNGQRQLIGVVLHAPDARAITVLQPPRSSDPFGEPPQAIQDLFRFSTHSHLSHRIRVDGVVVQQGQSGAIYIWDGTGGLLVQSTQADPLAVGDQVQVVGFPAMGDWAPLLEDAIIRRLGSGPPVPPLPTTAEREASGDAHDARLVTLDADLLDAAEQRGKQTLALRAGSVIFDAEVPARAGGDGLAELPRGSHLTLTGVSVARADKLLKRPVGFKLLLRDASDVVVRSRPSWWTLRRLLGSLTALAATFALVVIWVVILRRRVRDQTEIIRVQLQHEAALEERYRDLFENANDVVFSTDVAGHLTAINRVAEQITGYRRAELLSRTLYELLPVDRREEARWLFGRVIAGDAPPPTFETAVVARDGRVVPLEMTVRLTVQSGRAAGVEGIARDVSARKKAEAELAAANQRLLDVSRRAGMAEVASSVLHNVGNVLNSVNVSAALLGDRLRASRAPNLARGVAMLREREAAGDLAAFLRDDPQGRQLSQYLSAAAEQLTAEQQDLLQEVAVLGRSVDHIKEIVAMQQGYARSVGGVTETQAASALLADALRMNAESLERHHIQLVREVTADPEVTVEKHKVLQILVNLVTNAKNACGNGRDGAAGRVTVRVEAAGETRVRFVVSDNGVGIPRENLTRVFEHGFTTRQEGHGFGLHSAALTARELGGSLSAASEGPGRGAVFTLELPISPEHGEKRTTKERLKIVNGRA